MIFKRLKIKNFLCHKNIELNFTKGVNTIIGESGVGKSSIIRALYLLLENQPRGSEKLFSRIGTSKSIEIELEDDKGNIVKRKKKKYYLNGVEYKAFNKEVPAPIKELFFTKSINWHKQLDSHFLILSNPGQAAKALNASTGLEEQEGIIKEIKERQSECKSEIKRLTINANESKDKIKELRPVVKYLLNAKSIKSIENKLNKKQEEIETLSILVNSVIQIEKKIQEYDIKLYLSQITELLDLVSELEKVIENKQKLVDLISKVEEDSIINEEVLNSFIKETYELIQLLPALSDNVSSCSILSAHLETILTIEKDLKEKTDIIEETEKEFIKLLEEIGVCPLCNQKT